MGHLLCAEHQVAREVTVQAVVDEPVGGFVDDELKGDVHIAP